MIQLDGSPEGSNASARLGQPPMSLLLAFSFPCLVLLTPKRRVLKNAKAFAVTFQFALIKKKSHWHLELVAARGPSIFSQGGAVVNELQGGEFSVFAKDQQVLVLWVRAITFSAVLLTSLEVLPLFWGNSTTSCTLLGEQMSTCKQAAPWELPDLEVNSCF